MLKKIGLVALIVLCPMWSARSQTAPTQTAVIQQLTGRWEKPLTDTSTPAPMGLRFFSNGKMMWSLPYGYDFMTRVASWGKYAIDPKPKPMHIELQYSLNELGSTADRENAPPVVFEVRNARTLWLQQIDTLPQLEAVGF